MAIVNRYRTRCYKCRTTLEPNEGVATKSGSSWIAWCDSCYQKEQKSLPQAQVVQNGRVLANGEIYFPYNAETVTLVKSLAGARWSAGKRCWTVSLDLGHRHRLLEVADRLKFDVDPSLRDMPVNDSVDYAIDAGLYSYQVEGVQFLSLKNQALLGDDPGLGKTCQSLMALPGAGEGKAVVLCPAVMKYTWQNEITRWRPDYRAVVLEGRGSWRWPEKGEIVILNYDILPDFFSPPARGRGADWRTYQRDRLNPFREGLVSDHPQSREVTLIADEVHRCKSYKTARSQKVRELVHLVLQGQGKVWGLTGTPLDNRPGDLYGVLSTLEMAFSTFGSWANYLELFGASQDRWGGTHWGDPSPQVAERLRRFMLRRRRQDVLTDLPDVTYTDLLVNGTSQALQQAMDDLWQQYGDLLQGQTLPPFEQFSRVRAQLAQSRIPALLELVEDCEEENVPTVVFSAHLEPLEALGQREGWMCITGETPAQRRQEIVDAFQAGKLQGVGVSIRAGGVGLTLTRAWRAVFVDHDWNPSANVQAVGRLNRIGQKSNKIEVIRMVSRHALDRHVLRLLDWKSRMIEQAVDSPTTSNA